MMKSVAIIVILMGIMVLSIATDGKLLYNYANFSGPTLKYIYGYIPEVPFTPYNIITSSGLRTIILKKELEADGATDSDGDGLTDWDEVIKYRVTVNSDNSVTLPTYPEYIDSYFGDKLWTLDWTLKYYNIRNKEGKTIDEMLSEVYVLPIKSNPALKDSDGDGILDNDEVNWDGVDERYSDLGLMHKDTIETLFPEIKYGGYNKTGNPSYLTVDDNHITMHLKVVFKGDASVEAHTVLRTEKLHEVHQAEVDEIESRLGTKFTLKELIKDAVKDRWEGTYSGSKYDFYNGMRVQFSVEFEEPEWYQKKINVKVVNGKCGFPQMKEAKDKWNIGCNKNITMYTSHCKDEGDRNKDGSTCYTYNKNLYDIAAYSGTVAHEFGHVFGLGEMYADPIVNVGYEPVVNDELRFSKDAVLFAMPSSYGIMRNHGAAVANDIEMMLLAFCENKWQNYVPYASERKISKAIKSDVTYYKESTDKTYKWDESIHEMVRQE